MANAKQRLKDAIIEAAVEFEDATERYCEIRRDRRVGTADRSYAKERAEAARQDLSSKLRDYREWSLLGTVPLSLRKAG